jgi:hypothetical protein
MPIDGWRIHRRIGVSGGGLCAREVGRELSPAETEAIQLRHGAIFRELLPERQPLPLLRRRRCRLGTCSRRGVRPCSASAC